MTDQHKVEHYCEVEGKWFQWSIYFTDKKNPEKCDVQKYLQSTLCRTTFSCNDSCRSFGVCIPTDAATTMFHGGDGVLRVMCIISFLPHMAFCIWAKNLKFGLIWPEHLPPHVCYVPHMPFGKSHLFPFSDDGLNSATWDDQCLGYFFIS